MWWWIRLWPSKYNWKIGDRLNIKGLIFPLNLELTVRGIFTAPTPTQSIYFNKTYIDEGFAQRLKAATEFSLCWLIRPMR